MNLPIIQRQIKDKSIVREIVLATGLQAVVGIATMAGQALLLHRAGVPCSATSSFLRLTSFQLPSLSATISLC